MFVYPKALQFSEAYGDNKKDSKFLELQTVDKVTVDSLFVCHHDKKCSISATLLNIFPKIKKWSTLKRIDRFFRSHLDLVGYTASGISTFIYIIHNMLNSMKSLCLKHIYKLSKLSEGQHAVIPY